MFDMTGMLPFFKLLVAFGVMLAGMRFRLSLALSILCGALVLGPLFGILPWLWLESALQGVFQDKAWLLAGIVGTMLLLNDMLEESGQGARLMETLGGCLRRPAPSLIFFPALIGLLPMPGGAIFSAPLLRDVTDRLTFDRRLGSGLGPVDMAVINYWFRHVWELCWPLYPGLILAASLSDIPLLTMVAYGLPGSVLCAGLGWALLLRPVLRSAACEGCMEAVTLDASEETRRTDYWRALREGMPVLLAITGALGLEAAIASWAPGLHYEFGIIAAMLLAISCSAVQNRMSARQLLRLLARRRLWTMIAVIFAIFVFKEVLLQTGAITQMGTLAGAGASLFVSAVLLPCLMASSRV